MNKQGFQLCPRCEGSGKRNDPVYTGHPLLDLAFNLPTIIPDGKGSFKFDPNICPVCDGKMIISIETGKPPADEKI